MTPFGEWPKECPKCGLQNKKGDWYVEFHGEGMQGSWSCYSKGTHLPTEHLHVECPRCRWSFPSSPKDA